MDDVLTPKVRSVENMVQRARGATRKSSSPACPVCHIKAWISLFFDGTGPLVAAVTLSVLAACAASAFVRPISRHYGVPNRRI